MTATSDLPGTGRLLPPRAWAAAGLAFAAALGPASPSPAADALGERARVWRC